MGNWTLLESVGRLFLSTCFAEVAEILDLCFMCEEMWVCTIVQSYFGFTSYDEEALKGQL